VKASNEGKGADSATAKAENAEKVAANASIGHQDAKAPEVEAEASGHVTADQDAMEAAEEAENALIDAHAVVEAVAEVTVETEATDLQDAKVVVTLEDGAKRLGTNNLTPGRAVYNERLIKWKGEEYRVWDAFRSKLAGAIIKGLQTVPIEAGSKVLYLDQATFQTSSAKQAKFTASNLHSAVYAT
jgi:hypothetical protein